MTYNERFEQILPGFFSQGIEIPSPDAEGVAQKATYTQSTLLTHTTSTAVEQVPVRFGLIDDSPDRWKKLRAKIIDINSSLKSGRDDVPRVSGDALGTSECKLLLLVRHGEGFRTSFSILQPMQHLTVGLVDNVAEAKYGTEAWDDYVLRYPTYEVLYADYRSYWSKLEGDGELVWGRELFLMSPAFFRTYMLSSRSPPYSKGD